MIYNRRVFLKAFLLGLASPFLSRVPTLSQPSPVNPTILENQKPGSTDWQLTNPATKREIEGYASLTSVDRGSEIKFFVNTSEPSYTIEIFRMGWYKGMGSRRMTEPITCAGVKQPPPIEDVASGLIECDWKNPFILKIPSNSTDPTDWASGIYLAKLTAGNSGKQSYIIFVVRDDKRASDILFQSSVTTFQAYNNWGGKSLYRWNSKGKQAYKVSFNRPYAASPNPAAAYGVGAGEFLTNFQPQRRTSSAAWEYNMVRWLEREGYDVTYATNVDTHFNKRLLLSHKVFLSVGHDEYWSWDMRQNVEAARDKGVSLGFFSANTCYWQIRFDTSRITGDVNRTIVAYKEMAAKDPFAIAFDPYYPRITTLWRDKRVNRPEDALIGVMYETFQVNSDIIIDNAPDWLLTGTGLKKGDKLPGLLGYEVDRMFGNAPKNTIRVCHSPYNYKGETRYSDMTIYTADSGALVFATGSMQWNWGLDDFNAPQLRPSLVNPAAQRITRNVLDRMIANCEFGK
ncbi:MAG TPA: hypothetical protein IGR89_10350 [Oscillatoriaceae cyanobacterium M7585_C2015_266]|nr:hypothetical protein [Oscillatoriaceae cyanobacterium M7585_C2015_266]